MAEKTKAQERYEQAEEELEAIVVDNAMYDKPQVAPDGHVNLSKQDIENRG